MLAHIIHNDVISWVYCHVSFTIEAVEYRKCIHQRSDCVQPNFVDRIHLDTLNQGANALIRVVQLNANASYYLDESIIIRRFSNWIAGCRSIYQCQVSY